MQKNTYCIVISLDSSGVNNYTVCIVPFQSEAYYASAGSVSSGEAPETSFSTSGVL